MTNAAPPTTEEVLSQIGLDRIQPAKDNLRTELGDLTELTTSIKAQGILEPLILAGNGTGAAGYVIVIGHRRYAAAIRAGLKVVPAIVRQLDERARVEAMLVENLQRSDLTALEEADAYQRLVTLGLGQAEIAKRTGRSQAHVSKRLSLLKLPKPAQGAIAAGTLPLQDALELVPFADEPEVIKRTVAEIVEDTRRGGFRSPARLVAEQTQRAIKHETARASALAKLGADKVPVLKGYPGRGELELGKTGYGRFGPRLPMSPTEHAKSPCHVAYVDHDGSILYLCTEPSNHAKAADKAVQKAVASLTAGERGKTAKAAQKKAAETREWNKALRAAAPARLKLARRLITPKIRDAALDFALRQLIQTFVDHAPAPARIAAQLLDVKAKDRDGRPSFKTYVTGPAKIRRLAYALALAAGEQPFDQLLQRSYFDEEFSSHAARYFAHLKAANYKALKIETDQIKPSSWRRAFDQ